MIFGVFFSDKNTTLHTPWHFVSVKASKKGSLLVVWLFVGLTRLRYLTFLQEAFAEEKITRFNSCCERSVNGLVFSMDNSGSVCRINLSLYQVFKQNTCLQDSFPTNLNIVALLETDLRWARTNPFAKIVVNGTSGSISVQAMFVEFIRGSNFLLNKEPGSRNSRDSDVRERIQPLLAMFLNGFPVSNHPKNHVFRHPKTCSLL